MAANIEEKGNNAEKPTTSNIITNPPRTESTSTTTLSMDQSTQIMLRPKPAFMTILRSIGIESDSLTRTEILDGLRRYIKERNLFDPNKPYIIRCEGDNLEAVFGEKCFHVNRVLALISQHTQLAGHPVTVETGPSRALDEVDGAPRIKEPDAFSSSEAHPRKTRRRKRGEGSSPETRERRRRKRCSSSISIVSSDGEGPWAIQVVEIPSPASSDKLSVQSKETNWVKSSSDTMVTDPEQPLIDWEDDDEPPFTIEYEVRSSSSGDYGNSDASSDDESHHRQQILVVCTDSDVEFFADYSESEDDESDPEIASDKWICSSCADLNSPLSRYCLCCWKERPGWLPEMGRFRRSLSAPTGIPSSSSSSSPPSNINESASQPLESTEPLDSGDVLPAEPSEDSSPIVPAKSVEESTFITPHSAYSSSLRYMAHHRMMNSVGGKSSAASASDCPSNQSFDSAFRSCSQESESSISDTPKPMGGYMSSMSVGSLPDSQESGIGDTSSYSLDNIAVSTASPDFSSPLMTGRSVHNRQSTCTTSIPFDDVDGPLPTPAFTSHSAFTETGRKSSLSCDISEGRESYTGVHVLSVDSVGLPCDKSNMERNATPLLDCVDGLLPGDSPVERTVACALDSVDGPANDKNIDSKPQHPTTSKRNDPGKSADSSSLTDEDTKQKSDMPGTSTQNESDKSARTKVSLAGECPFCLKQSSNAVLIHGKTGHQVCCYKCARKLRRRGKPCPVCRKPIQKVIKNFII